MGDLQVIGGIKKLNNKNYNTWATCMESYLQGQDLWEVVGGDEVTQPAVEDANGILQKWKIKAGKAMFALKTTIEEEMLEHIRDAKTPKEVWDTFVTLFSKKNDTRLQLLENELLSMVQCDMTIAQYFHKRIIIHGLRPEYRGFVIPIQGWPTQPSLVEFENLLAYQVAMAKQMGGVLLKGEEEAPYTSKSRGTFKRYNGSGSKKDGDKGKIPQGKEALVQGELRRITVIAENSMVSVTIAGRWVTWRKIVGPRKSMLKVILLLPVLRRITKMIGMPKRYSLWRKKN
ncbi:hypothetical protein Patl1_01721 [Pistacia atlantica]|uniref:Uncharacterized protein n=1 Tax=Pistacia atlantica TaxID=434234 RepID=A0ACC1CAJ1_9ROSI|nr:hypothetical protein Patl1_01721 [Pistacia atlantica]